MGHGRLNSSPLITKDGGTGRQTVPASLLHGAGGNALATLTAGALGDIVKLKNGNPLSLPGDRVLQAVMGTYSTDVQVTATTWVPTGLACSITPLYADSKILALVNQSGVGKGSGGGGGNGALRLSLWRGETNLASFGYLIGWTFQDVPMSPGTCSSSFLDNPATTTTLTYSTKATVTDGTGLVICQWGGLSTSTLVLLEMAN